MTHYLIKSKQGVARLLKMRGDNVEFRGARADSKWRLSIDPGTKCHFILGAQGGGWASDWVL